MNLRTYTTKQEYMDEIARLRARAERKAREAAADGWLADSLRDEAGLKFHPEFELLNTPAICPVCNGRKQVLALSYDDIWVDCPRCVGTWNKRTGMSDDPRTSRTADDTTRID